VRWQQKPKWSRKNEEYRRGQDFDHPEIENPWQPAKYSMYSTKSITFFSKFSMCHLSRLSIVLLTWHALGYSERVRWIGADWPKIWPHNSKMTKENVSGWMNLLPTCTLVALTFLANNEKRRRLLQSFDTFFCLPRDKFWEIGLFQIFAHKLYWKV